MSFIKPITVTGSKGGFNGKIVVTQNPGLGDDMYHVISYLGDKAMQSIIVPEWEVERYAAAYETVILYKLNSEAGIKNHKLKDKLISMGYSEM